MKITNNNQVSFDSLAKGDVFIYKGSVMMKIEPIQDWNSLTKVAICLDDGCATTLMHSAKPTMVTPVNAELIIS